jgi:enolase
MANYSAMLKEEERFQVVVEDAAFENTSGDLIDMAIVMGISYINLQGMGRASRSAKVDRLQEVLEILHSLKPEPVEAVDSDQ